VVNQYKRYGVLQLKVFIYFLDSNTFCYLVSAQILPYSNPSGRKISVDREKRE
jgi:hypothetical protein